MHIFQILLITASIKVSLLNEKRNTLLCLVSNFLGNKIIFLIILIILDFVKQGIGIKSLPQILIFYFLYLCNQMPETLGIDIIHSVRSNNLFRFTSGGVDKGIGTFEFVAKTQFLRLKLK